MEDILKIVKSLEDQNKAKDEKGGLLSMLLGTLGASLLGNMLAGKGVIRAGEEIIRAGYGSKASSIKRSSLKIF